MRRSPFPPRRVSLILTTLLAPFAVALAVASCGGCGIGLPGGHGGRIDLMSYNVENLFDDVHDGTEYREFDPQNGEWGTELFHTRMQQVAEVIRAAAPGGPDIVALAEVENGNALSVLNETYLKGMSYTAVTAEGRKTAVVVGLLSRFPVTSVRTHHLSLETSDPEPLRDILEARLDCNGIPLVLFVNHWKSKLGGAGATEAARRGSAGMLARRIRELLSGEPSLDILVAGDLNESWDEFARTKGAYPTALMPDASCESGCLPLTGDSKVMGSATERLLLFTPWPQGGFSGSYYLGGQWESIDHTLLAASLFDGHGLEYASFEVFHPSFLLKADGTPRGWSLTERAGFSDHLPLLLHLVIAR